MYHWRLKGSPYQIGTKIGNIFKRCNAEFPIVLDDFQLNYGIESGKLLKQHFPEAYEEVKAITDTIGYPNERFLAWLMCMGCCLDIDENKCAEVRGCTAFAFTCGEETYYARTNDLPPFLNKISKSILYQPDRGYKFILNTSSFTNGEEGINEHGLIAAMTFAIPKITEIKAGLNSVFLVRYLLEKCKTTKEGIATIQSLPVSSNCNILIADKGGNMVVIECNPYQKHIRYPMANEHGNKFIITVNELLSSEMSIHKAYQGNTFFSKERYSTAENALLKLKDNPIDNAKAILSGKCGFMCQYEKRMNFETIWASIFNLSDLSVYRAEGNPSKCSFINDSRLKICSEKS